MLRSEPGFERLRDQVKEIAGLLEEKVGHPDGPRADGADPGRADRRVVAGRDGADARRRCAGACATWCKLIEKQKRKPIYTDFEDEMGAETAVDAARLRRGHRLREVPRQGAGVPPRAPGSHRDPQAADEQGADRVPTSPSWSACWPRAASARAEDIERAEAESQGLGLFVRSLVGLDREAAKEALAGFLAGKTLSANQIEFVNLIVEPPDRARRDGGATALRVAVHRPHAARTRRPLQPELRSTS